MGEAGRLRVGDVELAYDDRGTGGTPLLLVHGFTGSRDDWADHVDALATRGRVVTYDHRGHGESTNTGDPAGYTFEQLVADLVGLLDGLGIDRCDLLGHSMGGMVALRAVLASPDRFRSLVLMDTAARPPHGVTAELMEAGGQVAREQGMEPLLELFAALDDETGERAIAEARWGAARQRARGRAKMLAVDPEAFAALGVLLAVHEPLSAATLAAITCPTTVVVGARDRGLVGPSRELAAAIPDARLVVIEGAWHSPQVTHPDEWRAAVLEHLAASAPA